MAELKATSDAQVRILAEFISTGNVNLNTQFPDDIIDDESDELKMDPKQYETPRAGIMTVAFGCGTAFDRLDPHNLTAKNTGLYQLSPFNDLYLPTAFARARNAPYYGQGGSIVLSHLTVKVE